MFKCVSVLAAICVLLTSVGYAPPASEAAPTAVPAFCEDYDYLVRTLMDNYPYWSLAERQAPRFREHLAACREAAVHGESLRSFWQSLQQALKPIQGLGHLNVLTPEMYFNQFYPIWKDSPTPWGQAVRNPATMESYRLLQNPLDPSYVTAKPASLQIPQQAPPVVENFLGVSLEILEQDGERIAILNVPTFFPRNGFAEKAADGQAMADLFAPFFRQAADCDHVIIDIRENCGGSDWAWQSGIVAPNLKQDLWKYDIYTGKDGSFNRSWLSSCGVRQGSPLGYLSELGFCPTDVEDMSSYWLTRYRVSPAGNAPALSGRLWLLTSRQNYSAATNFASFCKSTHFATLVGEPTSGGAGSLTPALICLPNTGLLVEYDILSQVNPDGSLNEETGILPDCPILPGESALHVCLREIRNLRDGSL